MNRMSSPRLPAASRARALALALLAVGCGSSDAAPPQPALYASETVIVSGEAVELLPIFAGGVGMIAPEVGEVESGEAVQVAPIATTTYTLEVASAGGNATAEITVDVVEGASLAVEFVGEPVAGGLVEVNGPRGLIGTTDSEASFEDLLPGEYVVRAPVRLDDGIVYYALVPDSTVELAAGGTATVAVHWRVADSPPEIEVLDLPELIIAGEPSSFEVRVSDAEDAPSELSLVVHAEDSELLAGDGAIAIEGDGEVRTVLVTSTPAVSGITELVLEVEDGAGNTASASVELVVAAMVTSAADDGAGSLREAVAMALDDGLILFSDELPGEIALSSGPLEVNGSLTVRGPGADLLALTIGGPASSLFTIQEGAHLELDGLTLRDAARAVVVNSGGRLDLRDAALVDNSAINGAAILNHGLVTAERVLFARNVSDCGVGCGTGGGAVLQFGTGSPSFTAVDSVFSANVARASGGASGAAIRVEGGSLVLTRSTVTENVCEGPNCHGGAVAIAGIETVAEFELSGSILSGNIGGSPEDLRLVEFAGGAVIDTSLGHSVIGDADTGFTLHASDVVATNPQLTALGDHGGPFETHVPLPGSPASELLPAGTAGEIDARGLPRRTDGSDHDSGAVERQDGDPTSD